MTTFADDLHALVDTLRGIDGVTVHTAEIGAPCSDAEIEEVEERLWYPFDAHFLSYYRSANGVRIKWSSERNQGGIDLVPLRSLPTKPGHYFGDQEEYEESTREYKLFGGILEKNLRGGLRVIDDHPKYGDSQFPTVGVLLNRKEVHATLGRLEPESAEIGIPAVIFPGGHGARMEDNYPMLATSYFEMLLATAGHSKTLTGELANHSSAIEDFTAHYAQLKGTELNTWGREAWKQLGGAGTYVRWLESRVVPPFYPRMSKLSEALRAGVTLDELGPKRWLETRFDVVYPAF